MRIYDTLSKIQSKGLIEELDIRKDGSVQFYLRQPNEQKAKELCIFLRNKFTDYAIEHSMARVNPATFQPQILISLVPQK